MFKNKIIPFVTALFQTNEKAVKAYWALSIFFALALAAPLLNILFEFKPGVKLTENLITNDIKNPKSILFVFDVVGCEANFYNDLTDQLEKRFKKSDTEIGFNYDIYTNVEIEKIPKKVFPKTVTDYATCQV